MALAHKLAHWDLYNSHDQDLFVQKDLQDLHDLAYACLCAMYPI